MHNFTCKTNTYIALSLWQNTKFSPPSTTCTGHIIPAAMPGILAHTIDPLFLLSSILTTLKIEHLQSLWYSQSIDWLVNPPPPPHQRRFNGQSIIYRTVLSLRTIFLVLLQRNFIEWNTQCLYFPYLNCYLNCLSLCYIFYIINFSVGTQFRFDHRKKCSDHVQYCSKMNDYRL